MKLKIINDEPVPIAVHHGIIAGDGNSRFGPNTLTVLLQGAELDVDVASGGYQVIRDLGVEVIS